MIQKIDHVGIAVESLEKSIEIYKDFFSKDPDDVFEFPDQNVKIAFFEAGESSIELLQPLSSEGAIAKFLQKKGEGIHHICYRVEDLKASMNALEKKGYTALDKEPRNGAHNTKVCFFHPKQTGGVLIELSQKGV